MLASDRPPMPPTEPVAMSLTELKTVPGSSFNRPAVGQCCGWFVIRFWGERERLYHVQMASNVVGPWTTLEVYSNSTEVIHLHPMLLARDIPDGHQPRFFRVMTSRL